MIMKIRGDKVMNKIKKTMPWGKWLIIFTLAVICVGMGTTQAFAITSNNNNFTMMTPGNAITGGMNDVVFIWDGTQKDSVAKENQVSNVQFASACPFFGFTWSTHDNALYGPGTYTVYTACPGGSPGCGQVKTGFPPLTFTVGPDELGVHYQFDWSVSTDIDMINVFKRKAAFGPSPMCTLSITGGCGGFTDTCGPTPDHPRDKVWDLMSRDVDGDGVNGLAFVDGPFIGFSGNMNVMVPGGIPAHLLPDANPVLFGTLSADKILTISNNGEKDLLNISVKQPPEPFSIIADTCTGKTLAPGQTCSVTIHFEAPEQAGEFGSSFLIDSNDAGTPTRISINTGNLPPNKPELVYPEDGATDVSLTTNFRWNITDDPDANAVSYQVFICSDSNFAGTDCAPATVASRDNGKGVFYAGGAGLLMIGMIFIGGLTGRKRTALLVLLLVLFTAGGGAILSCKSSNKSETPPPVEGQASYYAPNLSSAKTYYWKVVADDGQSKNNLTSSDTRSFTTK